jgi:hypothetical protein
MIFLNNLNRYRHGRLPETAFNENVYKARTKLDVAQRQMIKLL